MTPIPANATGAWCSIKYHDEATILSPVFFSFGEYDEEKDPVHDTLGHRDDLVFYYTTPEELPTLLVEGGHDFDVVAVDYYEVSE
jgi:hypothetical protein